MNTRRECWASALRDDNCPQGITLNVLSGVQFRISPVVSAVEPPLNACGMTDFGKAISLTGKLRKIGPAEIKDISEVASGTHSYSISTPR
jgi:hypothetical protein